MQKSLGFFGVIVSGMLTMGNGVALAETMQEAIKYQLLAHPEIRSQSYNRLARVQEVRQAKAGYLPTIDVSAGVGVNRQHQPIFDTVWPATATVSVRQNVFRFFGTQSEVERQEGRVKSQAYLLQGSAERIALQGARSYLNVLRDQELLDLAGENLVNHQRIYDQVKLRSESGVDRRADLDQVMGRLALAEANQVAAKANLADGKTDYLAVIGHMPGNIIKPDNADSTLPGTLEEAEQIAVNNNPVLKSAKADVEARNAQYNTAKSQFYPSIDVALDYSWKNDVNIDSLGKREGFLAMATISYNILNGGWNKARLAQTSLEIHEAEEIADNTKREVTQAVRLSWEAYLASKERVTFLEDYVKSAGQTAESFAAQWNIGRRTMFDLLDVQAEYINAKASLVNAKYDKMYSEYRVLTGISRFIQFLGLELPEHSRIELAQK